MMLLQIPGVNDSRNCLLKGQDVSLFFLSGMLEVILNLLRMIVTLDIPMAIN